MKDLKSLKLLNNNYIHNFFFSLSFFGQLQERLPFDMINVSTNELSNLSR